MQLKLDDSRRLTGPNLFWNHVGAIIDVSISGVDKSSVIAIWKTQARALLDTLAWHEEKLTSRVYQGGASLVISAPIDCLYAATEVNEAAWHYTLVQLGLESANNFSNTLTELKKLIKDEENPLLLQLIQTANKKAKPLLSDDDCVSIGYGANSLVFPVTDLPDINQIDWDMLCDIPLALITGTNGKSTSVRLTASIVKAASKKAGITTTDYIRVGDEVIDKGDYSGPGGARTLLRNPSVEVALLEVARGGLLRRGLAVSQASAALITNVAADHLGEYGINTVSDLASAKFVVHRALGPNAPLILNADNALSVEQAKNIKQLIHWFSQDENNPVIQNHYQETVAFVRDDTIVIRKNNVEHQIVKVSKVPITFNGAAAHNTQNCLGVSLLCFALGFSKEEIRQGLLSFNGDNQDNPGRGNYYEKNGVKIIIDFAHNPHGLRAVSETVKHLPASRSLVLLCQAGDRSDKDITDMVHAALNAKPDCIVVCELESHLRGRELGDVPRVITDALLKSGLQTDAIIQASSVLDGVKKALAWAQADDLLLLLALTDRDKVVELIQTKM